MLLGRQIAAFLLRSQVVPKLHHAATSNIAVQRYYSIMSKHAQKPHKEEGIVEAFMTSKARPRLSDAQAYIGRAKELVEQGQLEQAKQDYSSAILLEPQEAAAWGGRGDVNSQLANYDDAIKDYQQVLRLVPNCIPVLLATASCHAKCGRIEEAINNLTYLIKVDERYLPAFINRALLYTEKEELEKAADDYFFILKQDAGNVTALLGLGNICMHKKDFKDAKEIYERILKLDPKKLQPGSSVGFLTPHSPTGGSHPHVQAYCNLAQLELDQGDIDKALALSEKAMALTPTDAHSRLIRGIANCIKERYTEAVVDFEKVLSSNPENSAAHLYSARACHAMNLNSESLYHFTKYLDVIKTDKTYDTHMSEVLDVYMIRASLHRAEFLTLNKIHYSDEAIDDDGTEQDVASDLSEEEILARAQLLTEVNEGISVIEAGEWNPNIVRSDYMLKALQDIEYILQHFGSVYNTRRSHYLENAREVIKAATQIFQKQ